MFFKYLKNSFEEMILMRFESGTGEPVDDFSGPNLDGTENHFDKGYQITDFFNEEQLSTLSPEEQKKINDLLSDYNKLKKQLDDNELIITIPKERIKCINNAIEEYILDRDDDADVVERTNATLFLDHNRKEAEYYETIIAELSSAVMGIKNEIDMVKILARTEEQNSKLKGSRVDELIIYFEEQKVNAGDRERGIDLEHVKKSLKLLYALRYRKQTGEESEVSEAYARLLKKEPKLAEMGDYKYDQFNDISIYQRLQFVTKERENLDKHKLLSGEDLTYHITFDFGGNYNDELSEKLTAMMIFPEDVGKIKINGEIYTRKGYHGNFFSSEGKPLGKLEEGMEITLVNDDESRKLEDEKEQISQIPKNVKKIHVYIGENKTEEYTRGTNGIFKTEAEKVLILEEGLVLSYDSDKDKKLTYISGTIRNLEEVAHYEEYLKTEPGRFLSTKVYEMLTGVDEIKLGSTTYRRVIGEDGESVFRSDGKTDGEIFDPTKGGILKYERDGVPYEIDLTKKLANLKSGLSRSAPANLVWSYAPDLNEDNADLDISKMVEASGSELGRFSTEYGPIGESFQDDFMKLLKILFPFAADFLEEIKASLNGEDGSSGPDSMFESYGNNSLGEELATFCKSNPLSWDKDNPLCGRNVYKILKKFGKFPGIHSGDGCTWADQLSKRKDFEEVTNQYDCYNAPAGAIISYDKGTGGSEARQSAGHVEIALGDGTYYFGITASRPGGSDKNPTKGEYRIFMPISSGLDSSARNSHSPEKYNGEINKACSKTGVPRNHLVRLINHENAKWDPKAKANGSSAYGLGQMIDSTWATFGSGLNRDNPGDQLLAAAKYLQHLKNNKGCSWEEALAYYNTGEGIFSISSSKLQEYYRINPSITRKIPSGLAMSHENYFIGAIAYYNDISFESARTKYTRRR